MRVAFFSPLPPAKSGIADYSSALLGELRTRANVEIFSDSSVRFDPARHDVALYQLGNNSYHMHAYETALEHPGVVVLHEANLHHLICDLTIRRKNWDAYVAECEYNGGANARAFAERVRALEVGPDYDGLPMLRRVLERSRGVIVHSRCVAEEVRKAGFPGPIARIPHGAWLPEMADRMAGRHKLGLDERTPLIGIFGFLKPYKRVAESLRAFRRLVRMMPEVRMILVGEPHPELPLASLIRTLGLQENVRVTGYTPIEEFTGLLAACDVILNLRYPTVGESSGTLLRALGLGKAVLVSNIGSFAEFPGDVVLKVPVDASEEDAIFEYLNALICRPDFARQLGNNARRYVERECGWGHVAGLYADFLRAVSRGEEWREEEPAAIAVQPQAEEPVPAEPAPPSPEIGDDYLKSWADGAEAEQYLDIHLTRLQRTLEITPPGTAQDRILEMGAYLQITPALKSKLGYGQVRGCYFGVLGKVDHKHAVSGSGEEFECEIDLFNAEKDRFPYPDDHYSTVLCCELIEHLSEDPMFLMAEVNRILKPGGHLVLTTPNTASLRAISAILQGYHPGFFPQYILPSGGESETGARHSREYTPKEIMLMFLSAGFEMTRLETGPFKDEPKPELHWVMHLLERYMLPNDLRGDGIYAVGRKTGPVKDRYPGWLYQG